MARAFPKFLKMSEAQKQEAIRLYPLGWSCCRLAEHYGTTYAAIHHMLSRRGVKMRQFTEMAKRIPVNHSAFCVVTDESAYWAGFLMADGCIVAGAHANSSPQIVLALSIADIEHVKRFRAFLQYEGVITIQQRPAHRTDGKGQFLVNSLSTARLSVSSKLMAEDLVRFGVLPRKTFTAEVPEEFLGNKHFWRGLIDGDGSVHVGEKPYISLCGTERIAEQFLAYCHKISPGITRKVFKSGPNLWAGTVSGRTCEPILRALYGNWSIALPRKRHNAAILLERFKTPRRNAWDTRRRNVENGVR